MLMIMTVVSGKYTVAAGKEVANYLNHNGHQIPDLDHELETLESIPKENLAWYFKRAASYYYAHSTEEQRVDFMAYAYRLVHADNTISKEENRILTSLARFWKMDIGPMLEGIGFMDNYGLI